MILPLIIKTEKNLNKINLVNFVTLNNSRFLKVEAKAFEAGDFLNIFLRFWGF